MHFQNGKFRWSWALAASTMISHFHRYRLSIAHTVAAAAAVNDGDGVHWQFDRPAVVVSLKHSTRETDIVRNCVAGRRRTMLIISQ